MAGFVRGVETGRSTRPDSCPGLMSVGSGTTRISSGYPGTAVVVPAGRGGGTVETEAQARFNRGYADGVRLTQGLDAIRRLPGCYVPVPEE